jgi:Tfp pilus assembly protein PilP
MKARTIALLWLLTAVVAGAQTAPPSQKVVPAAKPAAASPFAKPAPAKAAKAVKPAVAKAAKPAAARKTAAKVTLAARKAPRGKRDPFVSPIVHAEGTAACAGGKKCLAIDTVVLRGIVKYQAGMIAVVESSARKVSYFLRENDPVFNGYVVKITGDSVVFRENVMDTFGRQSTRDVVKKVVAPVV